MSRNNYSFQLLAFAIMIRLTVPILIQDGMFMDGVLYASISKNLANGFGSFWFPQLSLENISPQSAFHDHPPLGFWIESLFFRILGNSMYTERVYTFVTMVISGCLISFISKMMNKNNTVWLTVILWILIPICFWSYANNDYMIHV